jgi:hypothetical protein
MSSFSARLHNFEPPPVTPVTVVTIIKAMKPYESAITPPDKRSEAKKFLCFLLRNSVAPASLKISQFLGMDFYKMTDMTFGLHLTRKMIRVQQNTHETYFRPPYTRDHLTRLAEIDWLHHTTGDDDSQPLYRCVFQDPHKILKHFN